MKKPRKLPPKPIYVNAMPIGTQRDCALLIMVDELGNTYMKIIDYDIAPIDHRNLPWEFLGNPL
jgi:hypothetical protein